MSLIEALTNSYYRFVDKHEALFSVLLLDSKISGFLNPPLILPRSLLGNKVSMPRLEEARQHLLLSDSRITRNPRFICPSELRRHDWFCVTNDPSLDSSLEVESTREGHHTTLYLRVPQRNKTYISGSLMVPRGVDYPITELAIFTELDYPEKETITIRGLEHFKFLRKLRIDIDPRRYSGSYSGRRDPWECNLFLDSLAFLRSLNYLQYLGLNIGLSDVATYRDLPGIQALHLGICPRSMDQVRLLTKSMPNLRYLFTSSPILVHNPHNLTHLVVNNLHPGSSDRDTFRSMIDEDTLSACENLRYLDIDKWAGCSNEDLLYLLPSLSNLEELVLTATRVSPEFLGIFTDMRKAGHLRRLRTILMKESSIDLSHEDIENKVRRLKKKYKMDIVVLGYNPSYVPSATLEDDRLEKILAVIDPESKLTDEQRDLLEDRLERIIISREAELYAVAPSTRGFTSTKGFEFGEFFIKLDCLVRQRKEHGIYCLDLGSFNQYRATEVGYAETRNEGILILNNLSNLLDVGLAVAYSGSDYILYLMSLFHKESRKYAKQFPQVPYEGVNGRPHYYELLVPYRNTTGLGYRRFTEVSLDTSTIIQHVTAYRKLQASADCLIDGDWKDDNMVNGRKVDFAMVGRGFEVDELAYYFSDLAHQHDIPTLVHFHQKIDEYARIRITHDPEFHVRAISGYLDFLHTIADSSLLTQLVLRMSVMNKRDMIDPEKFEQRQYYQYRINQVLGEGRFV